MENILLKFLKHRGIEDYSKLTPDEQATYKEWEKILSHQVKIEDVASFLEKQVARLNTDLRQAIKDEEETLAILYTAKIENYEAIIMLIRQPAEAKKNLEKQLLEQLK